MSSTWGGLKFLLQYTDSALLSNSTYYKLLTLYSTGLTGYLCCPQVVSFFHRAMLTVGIAVLSLWPFMLGLYDKAKVLKSQIMACTVTVQSGNTKWSKCSNKLY